MDIYEKIDAALRESERTRTRRPILDLLAQAWEEGLQDDLSSNPYKKA